MNFDQLCAIAQDLAFLSNKYPEMKTSKNVFFVNLCVCEKSNHIRS